MNTVHEGAIFNSVCIEGEYENDTFKNCTLIECYVEGENINFINCKFVNSYRGCFGNISN